MAFFCAGSSGEAKKKNAKLGSKPTANPGKHAQAIGSIPNGGRSSSQSTERPMPSIPHSNSHDLPPNSRKMIVLQEYSPQDNRGLMVKRGESVQVIRQDGNWLFVRNEWGKEGHVPSSHLVAPYSSMRSRSKSSSGHPIRSVASGSSIVSSDVDSSFSSSRGGVPMHTSQSAGRPQNFSSSDNHRIESRRVVSPPSLSQNDVIITSMSQGMATAYEQKYSPSSSSGVASMNGPLSPSYQFLQHSNSSENIDPHTHSSGSSITQDQSSLSSVEEHEQQQCSMETPPLVTNGHTSSSERIRSNGRTLSESHLSRVKTRPPQSGKKMAAKHNYTTISDDTPPPVPPRSGHTSYTSNRGEAVADRGDAYADPVDLVQQQVPFSSSSLRRENDVRIREVRMAKENGEYSEVYPGGTRSRGINGHSYPVYVHSQESESEGSSRRSSKKSSSTCKSSHSRGYPQEVHYDPREVTLSLPDEDEREIEILPTSTGQNPQTRIDKFRKFVWGVYIVTHEFESLDENEVSVHPGDHVSVFNQDDRDWYWVVKHSTAEEGFVPSCILEETSVPENSQYSQYSVMDVGAPVSEKPPPLPPKQPLHPAHGHTLYDHTQHFRQRAQSHDTRPPTTIVRRPSPAGGHRVRGRLNSDGSTPSSLRSSNKAPSTSSIEKAELRDSPPPPYSEYDRHHMPPPRHFSHSHHQPDHPYTGHSMQRTRSHGQVQFRRQGITPLGAIERSSSDRRVSPDQAFHLRSPTTVTGGTLV